MLRMEQCAVRRSKTMQAQGRVETVMDRLLDHTGFFAVAHRNDIKGGVPEGVPLGGIGHPAGAQKHGVCGQPLLAVRRGDQHAVVLDSQAAGLGFDLNGPD